MKPLQSGVIGNDVTVYMYSSIDSPVTPVLAHPMNAVLISSNKWPHTLMTS